MSKYNTYEQVKAYLYNRMSVEDRAAFEAALQGDEVFAEQFEELTLDFQIKEAILKDDLLEHLKRWDEVRESNVKKEAATEGKNIDYTKYIIGGIVLLILLVVLGYFISKSEKSQDETTLGETESPIDITITNPIDTADTLTNDLPEKEDKINPETQEPKQHATIPTVPKNTVEDSTKVTPPISDPEPPTVDPIKTKPPSEIKELIPEPMDSIQIYFAEIDAYIDKLINDEITTTRSIDSLTAIVAADSSDSESKYDLGLHYYQQDSLGKAIKYLEAFQAVEPYHEDMERVQLILCVVYLKKKQLDKAKPLLDKIITIEMHLYHKKYGDTLKVIWDSIKK